MKAWEKRAVELLEKSLYPVPQELNELDWKFDLSPDKIRLQACYQHAVVQHLANKGMTNTSLRERLKMSERQCPQVSTLIKMAVGKGFVKPKNPENLSSKFAEYIPYWV